MNEQTAPNPYAPPQSELLSVDGSVGVWRDGKQVVLSRSATMPTRCFKCNANVDGKRKTKRLFYYSLLTTIVVVLLILVFLPLALVVALLLRKSAKIEYSLCDLHRARQRNLLLLTLALLVATFAVPAFIGTAIGAGIGVALFVVALVPAILHGSNVRSGRIDKHSIRIKGAGQPFLQSLPPLGPTL